MKIVIGDLELSSEYLGSNDKDCLIKIQIENSPDIRSVKATELLAAIETLNKTCWRP